MEPKFEITFEEKPDSAEVAILGQGLKLHSGAIFGGTWIKDLAFFLRDESGAVRGGVFGNYGSFQWVYVDTLYVEEELRGNGYGAKLMSMIEAEGRRATGADTYILIPLLFRPRAFTKSSDIPNSAASTTFRRVTAGYFLEKTSYNHSTFM